jgi:hypothetical protein
MKAGSSGAKEYIELYKQNQIKQDLDLRDYFAGQALQGQLARTPWRELVGLQDVAKLCYQWADAMMEARNGNNE